MSGAPVKGYSSRSQGLLGLPQLLLMLRLRLHVLRLVLLLGGNYLSTSGLYAKPAFF